MPSLKLFLLVSSFTLHPGRPYHPRPPGFASLKLHRASHCTTNWILAVVLRNEQMCAILEVTEILDGLAQRIVTENGIFFLEVKDRANVATAIPSAIRHCHPDAGVRRVGCDMMDVDNLWGGLEAGCHCFRFREEKESD